MKLIFHPEIHTLDYFEEKRQKLQKQALCNEIILCTESSDYEASLKENRNIIGIENMDVILPSCVLCTTYQLSNVPYTILREGGKHGFRTFVFFLTAYCFFPNEMLCHIQYYNEESWYPTFLLFIKDILITVNIQDIENITTNVQDFVHDCAKKRGGLPAHIPFKFIHDVMKDTIQSLYHNKEIEDVIVQKTLIDREYIMYQNIKQIIETYNKHTVQELHIVIGAGHLMPYLSEGQMCEVGLDFQTIAYHKNIQQPRLLQYIQDSDYSYEICI